MMLVTGCTSSPAHSEHPALIVNATPESRAELLSVTRAALNNVPLTLADDVLTHESMLLIERQQRFDANGLSLNGRDLDRPERFLLSIDGKQCVLTHERTQQHWVLKQTRCKARE
jgi:hypothetical protein